MNDAVWAAIRYALIALGAFIAGKGWLPMDQVSSLADNIISVLTGLVSLAAALWGLYIAAKSKRVPIATAKRADVPTINPITGAVQDPSVVR